MQQTSSIAEYNTPGSAHMVALYRAIESERADALFHDPYARQLSGPEGEIYATGVRVGAWGIAVRTRVYDELLLTLLKQQPIDLVLNLAAGFDTRPYRLDLSTDLHWLEIDLPSILSRKDALLANEKPKCTVERIPLDLSARAERQALFERVCAGATNVLVITEGLLAYLTPEQVRTLSSDLHTQSTIGWWLTDFPPFYVGTAGTHEDIIKFAPREGVRFFEELGWQVARFRSLMKEAHRLRRLMPLAGLMRVLTWLLWLFAQDRKARSHVGGFLLLKKGVVASSQDVDTGHTSEGDTP